MGKVVYLGGLETEVLVREKTCEYTDYRDEVFVRGMTYEYTHYRDFEYLINGVYYPIDKFTPYKPVYQAKVNEIPCYGKDCTLFLCDTGEKVSVTHHWVYVLGAKAYAVETQDALYLCLLV